MFKIVIDISFMGYYLRKRETELSDAGITIADIDNDGVIHITHHFTLATGLRIPVKAKIKPRSSPDHNSIILNVHLLLDIPGLNVSHLIANRIAKLIPIDNVTVYGSKINVPLPAHLQGADVQFREQALIIHSIHG
jgi:hypothetical protein